MAWQHTTYAVEFREGSMKRIALFIEVDTQDELFECFPRGELEVNPSIVDEILRVECPIGTPLFVLKPKR